MKKTRDNLAFLTALFCTCLVISNVITGKVIDTGLTLLHQPVTVAGALICYPITYLITDIVGEIWGKREANKIVKYGFFCQIVATVIIAVTQHLPHVDAEMQGAYNKLLGQNWIFVLGSLVAYLASQYLDVTIFHKIREKVMAKQHTNRHRWIWNNASTITSQLVDTVIFIVIAFGFGFGWIFTNRQALFNMVLGQYCLKFVIALLDTPFFYFFTRGRRLAKGGVIKSDEPKKENENIRVEAEAHLNLKE